MISLTCAQCQTVLTIDDAFAGGACRCQHCGTIQTVPSRLKPSATPQPYVNPSATKSKALYQNEATARAGSFGATSPSGLDDLANAVASSSGLSGSGLHSGSVKTAAPPAAVTTTATARQAPAVQAKSVNVAAVPVEEEVEAEGKKKFPLVPVAVGGGVLIVALLGVIIYLLMGHGGSSSTNTTGSGGANFCGEALAGSKIVYVLDDANSIANDFDPLKAATYASINSLGSDHKFAVILWDRDGDQFLFPGDGMADASSGQLDALRAKFQDIQATGASHIRGALEKAIARGPNAIVIVTAKNRSDFEEEEAAIAAAKDTAAGKIKFYTFNIGADTDNQFLKMTADSTGGKYRHLSGQELRATTP